MPNNFREIDPAPAREFIAQAGVDAFEEILATMSRGARWHLEKLESNCFTCNTQELADAAHHLASLLAQFGFSALSRRVTVFEFAPHVLRHCTCIELEQRLARGIGELERLACASRSACGLHTCPLPGATSCAKLRAN